MPDITKCSGLGCRVKDKCYRFTAKSSERQSFFFNPPLKVENNILKCDMFWGENSQQIFNSIKEILDNGKT